MTEIVVGDWVKCQKNGNTDYDFYAKVEKVYDNAAYVTITNYDKRDDVNVSDLLYRAVIAFKKMKPNQLVARLNNYRPLALLCWLIKILEKGVWAEPQTPF